MLLVACQQQTPDAPPLPDVPQQPTIQENTPDAEEPVEAGSEENAAEPVENSLDDIFGERDEEQVITVDDIVCDPEERTLTFRFRNLDEKSWQLDGDVPFPAPTGLAGVRITLNNYEINGHRDVIIGGERMFGPEERFSANCEGEEVLEPGEEIVCTVQPIPLKESTSIARGVNELRINGVGADGIARFTCE